MIEQALIRTAGRVKRLERDRATEAPGIWEPFTPNLYQNGVVAATVSVARYQVFGRSVHVLAYLISTGVGSAGNAIIIQGLPKANAFTNPIHAGVFHVTTLTNHYSGTAWMNNLESACRGFGFGATGAIGFNPSLALAVGTIVGCNLFYEW